MTFRTSGFSLPRLNSTITTRPLASTASRSIGPAPKVQFRSNPDQRPETKFL